MICHTIPKSWLAVIMGGEVNHPEVEDIREFQREILAGKKLSHVDSTYSYAGIVQTFWLIDPLPALKTIYKAHCGLETAADIIERINHRDEWFEEDVIRPFLVDVKFKHPDIWTYAVMLSGKDNMGNHSIWMDPSKKENMPCVAYWVYYAVLECLDRGYHVDAL